MKNHDVPACEQLSVFEKALDVGHVVMDTVWRGFPTIGGLPCIETQFHNIRTQIDQLETAANDPYEHH